MLIDHEQAWLLLKEVVRAKRAHGADGLLVEMSRLEVECRVEEGIPERALRLYGIALGDFPRPAPPSPAQPGLADGHDDSRPAGRPGDSHRPQEDTRDYLSAVP